MPDRRHLSIRAGARTYRVPAVPVVASLTAGVALTLTLIALRIGPRVLWATDTCPSPTVTCGQLPLAVFAGALVPVVLLSLIIPEQGEVITDA